MAGADTPHIQSPRVEFQPGRLRKEPTLPIKPPTPRELLSEAAEARRRGDLAAALAAENDALRLARAAGAGGAA